MTTEPDSIEQAALEYFHNSDFAIDDEADVVATFTAGVAAGIQAERERRAENIPPTVRLKHPIDESKVF